MQCHNNAFCAVGLGQPQKKPSKHAELKENVVAFALQAQELGGW